MQMLKTLIADMTGLYRTCGPGVAARFATSIVTNVPVIWMKRDFQPADRALGTGPFEVRLEGATPFRICGDGVISGIREMYVRDCYREHGALQIRPGAVVLDLGANVGNFTNMALALGAARVIAVEPSSGLNGAFTKSVSLNPGFMQRVSLFSAFLGTLPEKHQAIRETDPNYRDASFMNEAELIEAAKIDRLDYLKCDIEGGEFAFLTPNCRLLQIARAIAIEIHAFAGDVQGFVNMLTGMGFQIRSQRFFSTDRGCCWRPDPMREDRSRRANALGQRQMRRPPARLIEELFSG